MWEWRTLFQKNEAVLCSAISYPKKTFVVSLSLLHQHKPKHFLNSRHTSPINWVYLGLQKRDLISVKSINTPNRFWKCFPLDHICPMFPCISDIFVSPYTQTPVYRFIISTEQDSNLLSNWETLRCDQSYFKQFELQRIQLSESVWVGYSGDILLFQCSCMYSNRNWKQTRSNKWEISCPRHKFEVRNSIDILLVYTYFYQQYFIPTYILNIYIYIYMYIYICWK